MTPSDTRASGTRIFPRSAGWRRVLLIALSAGALITVTATALGWAFADGAAAASAAGGGACVMLLSGLTLALIDWAERHAPALTVTLFMAGFVIKLVVLGILLGAVDTPAWVDPPWAGLTATAVVVGWQAAEIMAFMRMRVTVEPADDGRA